MKKFFSIALLFVSQVLSAQTGNYFLSHYSDNQQHINNVCFDIAQDKRGVMYFATNAGVLQFDGKNWDALKGESAVYSLHIHENGQIFWGGAKGFGKVGTESNGFQQLELLSDSLSTDIFQIYAVQDFVYFLTDEAIYQYSLSTQKTKTISSSYTTSPFIKIFELYGALYVDTESEGIFKLDGKGLSASRIKLDGNVVFFSKIDNNYLVGTSENKIFLINESLNPEPIKIEDERYVNASVIVNGCWVNRQLLAIGTLRGGVIFINPMNGKTEQITDYNTGLPDNEVFAMMPDRNQNVWIAHDYGFTRISPYLPFRTFSHYAGIQGNPLCAYSIHNSVYVGTSLGLFKLESENVYDELVYYVDVEVAQPKKSVSNKNTPVAPAPKVDQKTGSESKKRGVFNFLKKKKNKETDKQNQETTINAPTSATEEDNSNEGVRYRREKRTEKILRSSQYVYKKVNGIDAKITGLMEFDGKLVASGLGGLYEVSGLNAKSIQDDPVRALYGSDGILFASTYDDKIVAMNHTGGAWHYINSVNNLNDQMYHIFDGKKGELWLCGLNKIHRLEFSKEHISIAGTLDIRNPEMETTLGVAWKENVMFANSSGFFSYDRTSNKIVALDSLGQPSQYFTHDGSILYRNDHGWNLIGNQISRGNLQLLNLFHDLRYISSDQQPGNLWIISRNNELYKFFGDRISPDEVVFPLFLKTITTKDSKLGSVARMHISEDKSAVRFEIIQPDYVSPETVEFRYQLKGMSDQWSEWANINNIVDFPYLPPGDYTLLVQSKNIFGKYTDLEPVHFEVSPPYWQTSWFYAMEFALLASLVLLSFRLNERYRIVSRILSLLTIILLIQFIQTVINANIQFEEESPVIDFIIQVFVALLILPVEGYLRNLMFRSLDPSSKIYQFVASKSSIEKARKRMETFETHDKDK